MSLAGNILGISDLEVERVDRDHGIEIYARPTRRPQCIYCQHDCVRIKRPISTPSNTPGREIRS